MEGDSKGGHSRRQLNIVGGATVDELCAKGHDTRPGQLGEHIVVSEMDVNSLIVGDRLWLGEALIEVTGHRTGCDRFKAAQKTERDDVALGIMAQVIEGGVITVGDAVVLERDSASAN